jgi:hypothetical protein
VSVVGLACKLTAAGAGRGLYEGVGRTWHTADHVMLALRTSSHDKRSDHDAPHDKAMATIEREGVCVLGADAKVDLDYPQSTSCIGQCLRQHQRSDSGSTMLRIDIHVSEVGLVGKLCHRLALDACLASKRTSRESFEDGA